MGRKTASGLGGHACTSTATPQGPTAGLTPWDNWGLIPLFQVFLQLRIALFIENSSRSCILGLIITQRIDLFTNMEYEN